MATFLLKFTATFTGQVLVEGETAQGVIDAWNAAPDTSPCIVADATTEMVDWSAESAREEEEL